jgi:hypothetical protein
MFDVEHLAPVDPLLVEVAGPGVEGLLPACGQDLLKLGAAASELGVDEDALLACLPAPDAADEARGTGDDVRQGLGASWVSGLPRGQSLPRAGWGQPGLRLAAFE